MNRSEMFHIDEKVYTEAPKLFGKTREKLEEETKNLEEWMKNQEGFPEVMDSKMLRNFIIINKFNTDKAKDRIANYYKMRVKYPDVYVNTNPKHEHIQLQANLLYFVCLPRLTNEHDRLIYYKMRDSSLVSQFNVTQFISYVYNVFELRLQQDFMVNTIAIVDFKEIPLNVLLKYTPMRCYMVINIMEKVYSFRLKKIYLINMPSYGYFLLKILKKVMKPKMYERLEVHSDDSILEKAFSKEYLPADYGGTEKSMEELFQIQKECMKELQSRFDRLDGMHEELMNLNKEYLENQKHHCTIS